MLARCMSCPTLQLLAQARQVQRYLKGIPYTELAIPTELPIGLHHSGWVYTLAGAPVAWVSKKQHCVALSFCEAEIMASSMAAQECVYLVRDLLADMGLKQTQPTTVFMDNMGAIALSNYDPMMVFKKASKAQPTSLALHL
eukprot:5578579-Pleurochrysis_carterae.AAC.2